MPLKNIAPGRLLTWHPPAPEGSECSLLSGIPVLVPTGQQRSPWSRSRPCDTLAPIPLGFIIVILFIFSIKNKKSHIQQRVLCGSLSLAPPSCSSPPTLPPSQHMAQAPALAIPSFCREWVRCPRLPCCFSPQFSVLFPTLDSTPR